MAPDCSWIVPTLFSPWWDHSKQAHGKTKAKTTNSTFIKPIVPHQYLLHHGQITFHACSNIGGKGLLGMESITSLCESWLFLVPYTPQDHTSIRQSISYPIRKCCLQADPWHTKAALPSMCRIALFQLWQGLPRKLFSEGNNNVATTNTTSNRKATHLMTQDPSWENMPTIQRGIWKLVSLCLFVNLLQHISYLSLQPISSFQLTVRDTVSFLRWPRPTISK